MQGKLHRHFVVRVVPRLCLVAAISEDVALARAPLTSRVHPAADLMLCLNVWPRRDYHHPRCQHSQTAMQTAHAKTLKCPTWMEKFVCLDPSLCTEF